MLNNRHRVFLVGAFPPPVHGMAAVNAAVRQALRQIGIEPMVIDLAAPSLDRSPMVRLGRLPRVLRGLAAFACARGLRGGTFYMSVSGGMGQVYELLFVVLARLRGMRLFLHHHSFAYLDKASRLTSCLSRAAGGAAVQITLSSRMAERVKALYACDRVLPISNSVILLSRETVPAEPRRALRTLGFISNIAAEKGVFEFLDLLESASGLGLPLRGKLAGPFQDAETERRVRSRLAALSNTEYVGPQYGTEKDAFFADIDLLVFPTLYINEAEPLTIHEAMSRAVPIIAYGRGAIAEIVSADSGQVVDAVEPFVPAALRQIEVWLADPAGFAAASRFAVQRFTETYAQNETRWRNLLCDLAGSPGAQVALSVATEDRSSKA